MGKLYNHPVGFLGLGVPQKVVVVARGHLIGRRLIMVVKLAVLLCKNRMREWNPNMPSYATCLTLVQSIQPHWDHVHNCIKQWFKGRSTHFLPFSNVFCFHLLGGSTKYQTLALRHSKIGWPAGACFICRLVYGTCTPSRCELYTGLSTRLGGARGT